MDADDAWSAEIRRLLATPDPDPLALDEDTAERLLAGDLPPDQAPPGYAEVAKLLAATVAAPSPGEFAGQEAALAELQAVARARRASTRGASTRGAGKPGRRRRVGLVVAIAVGALSTGGIAAAATGNLPDPIRDAARSIFTTGAEATPVPSPKLGRQPLPSAGTADAAGATSEGRGASAGESGPTAVTDAVKDDLCRASKAHKGAGRKMDAAAFKALAKAAGGADKITTYCKEVQPGGTRPSGQGKQAQSGNHGHGQGTKPPPGTESKPGQGQGGPPPSSSHGNPEQGKAPDKGPQR